MKRTLPIANFVALVITIAINFLSNTRWLSGETVAAVSGRYPTLITPASYAFGIWGLIYLLLIGFAVYQLRSRLFQSAIVKMVGEWFIVSCVANGCWVIAFVCGLIGWSVVIILLLLLSLIIIVVRTNKGIVMTSRPREFAIFLWWPFGLYLGWVMTAAAVNVAAWLVSIGWDGKGLGQVVWAEGMVIIVGLLYLFVSRPRNLQSAAVAGIWALIAVGVADKQQAPGVAHLAWLVAVVLTANLVMHICLSRRRSVLRRRTVV